MARHPLIRLAKTVYQETIEDRLGGLAAEVAFFGVLSLFPGLVMVASALGSLEALVGSDLARRSQLQILGFLNLVFTEQAAGAVEAVESLFEDEGGGGLLTLASAGALIALSRGFAAVTRALNLAYDVEEKRTWLSQRTLGLVLAIGSVAMAVLMMVMIVVGPLLGGGRAIADVVGMGEIFEGVWRWLRWPVAFALLVAWATTLFHLAPNRARTPWRMDLPGSFVVAVMWLVVSLGLNLYLRVAAGANPVFGVLGGGLILLIWLYLLALVLLVGGELNAVLASGTAASGRDTEGHHGSASA